MTDQSKVTPLSVKRFDAYEVSPVVEITAPDGEKYCEAFPTLKAAQNYLNDPSAEGTLRILWTLYGHRNGSGVEAIADLTTEAEAFDMLYSIAGIKGVSGQKIYPVPYFTTVWTVTSDTDNGMETRVHVTEREAYWDFLLRWEAGEEDARGRELFNVGSDFGELNDYLRERIRKGSNDSFSVEAHTLHF